MCGVVIQNKREIERQNKERMKGLVLCILMTRAEIIIPDEGQGTLCRCYTDHVMSDVDKVTVPNLDLDVLCLCCRCEQNN